MSTKEILLEVAEQLPADATLLDAIAEIETRRTATFVEAGTASPAWHEPILKDRLKSLADGTAKFLTIEEVEKNMGKRPR